MALMEKNKCYKMNLCIIPDAELVVQGDKFNKYYKSVNGTFVPNEKFIVQDSIIVKKESFNNYVTVVGTDIEIPCVILEIENVLSRNEYDSNANIVKYISLVEGRTDKMLVAFAISKIGEVPVMEHEESFMLKEATEEEINSQLANSLYYNFADDLQALVNSVRTKEVSDLRTYKENLKNEKKSRMTRVIKKILP